MHTLASLLKTLQASSELYRQHIEHGLARERTIEVLHAYRLPLLFATTAEKRGELLSRRRVHCY
ncbi:MAG TPA: hypothetical protein VGF67_05060 [Ktedonobacteraceae bacterium]